MFNEENNSLQPEQKEQLDQLIENQDNNQVEPPVKTAQPISETTPKKVAI